MKTAALYSSRYTTYRRNSAAPYPGVRTGKLLNKLVNAALCVAIALGTVMTILFLLIL